ncbi:MAG: TerC family protein [Rhodomicrobium sp.]
MELFLDPAAWASLVTLTSLEIVLGVDNVVVLAILTTSLPKQEARRARSAGLGLALALRLLLLSAITWITRLTAPLFNAAGVDFSWRSLILIAGGLFLMVKAIQEIHADIENDSDGARPALARKGRFAAIILKIAVMDLIFSLDSIVTAVGLARDIEIMAAAICIAVGIMYFAASVTGEFIERHPTVKMLALCFLMLIGVVLVADGLGTHIPRVYIYFAMAFAGLVESLNIWVKAAANRRTAQAPGAPGTGSKGGRPALRLLKGSPAGSAPLVKASWQPAPPTEPKKARIKKKRRR